MDDLRRWGLAAAPDWPVEENACNVTEPRKSHPLLLSQTGSICLWALCRSIKRAPKKSHCAVDCATGLKTTQVFNQKTNISESFICFWSLAGRSGVHLLPIWPASSVQVLLAFPWLCVGICISLFKIIQVCLAEFIFICLFFFESYAKPWFLIKSLANSSVDIIPTWKTSMACFIIKRIGTLNRYYVIVASIPDTLIVIPPTHTLSVERQAPPFQAVSYWTELCDVASDVCSRRHSESCWMLKLTVIINHQKSANSCWGGN